MDLLEGKELLHKSGKLFASTEVLKTTKTIIFYFGASWCTQCNNILKILRNVYKENIKRRSGLEIIYVSSDSDKKVFEKHFKEIDDWYAVPLDDELGSELRFKYGVTYIPNIIVVKKDGEIITRAGKQELEEKGINVLITWTDSITA